ncbi:hypothetical protein IE077_000823 [Cardiosporidium cionae]|uniref:FCP1 homology domain-containing protein n=1 Tax=Cardiosporidium cionae TaxID=476202 RepID=A0ABQ7JE77_9APIC|nr:hypothetical protein IE077_000823 [Cardiosporidium cionae]|eukprot:KAF8822210.1 hypothetical protein IE077_000823 [Cardiosporidium cionae]
MIMVEPGPGAHKCFFAGEASNRALKTNQFSENKTAHCKDYTTSAHDKLQSPVITSKESVENNALVKPCEEKSENMNTIHSHNPLHFSANMQSIALPFALEEGDIKMIEKIATSRKGCKISPNLEETFRLIDDIQQCNLNSHKEKEDPNITLVGESDKAILFLDLEGTLLHCSQKEQKDYQDKSNNVNACFRPYLQEFLHSISVRYELKFTGDSNDKELIKLIPYLFMLSKEHTSTSTHLKTSTIGLDAAFISWKNSILDNCKITDSRKNDETAISCVNQEELEICSIECTPKFYQSKQY